MLKKGILKIIKVSLSIKDIEFELATSQKIPYIGFAYLKLFYH